LGNYTGIFYFIISYLVLKQLLVVISRLLTKFSMHW